MAISPGKNSLLFFVMTLRHLPCCESYLISMMVGGPDGVRDLQRMDPLVFCPDMAFS